ncbi:integrase [Stenotrophomonas phage Siara]|uniref:Uncharacterized protein n=1 Tax=Stenotrophomonas phage Siara TaxID=2859658 RepID=A0AAE8BJG9_9CAUD|nr:integrase [Stenotrophomonas phage Siara]QYW02096.1 hypothetical protein CPT_Siara_096 [Stenotrophomonas phage Siara]
MKRTDIQPIFMDGFESREDLINNFQGETYSMEANEGRGGYIPDPDNIIKDGFHVLFAIYEQEAYEGSAFVLIGRDGKLFEVNGSHCSCMGLEGQWEEEETTVEALRHRMEKGELGKESEWDYENHVYKYKDKFGAVLEAQLVLWETAE